MTSVTSILRGRRPLACMEILCARTGRSYCLLRVKVERVGKAQAETNNER